MYVAQGSYPAWPAQHSATLVSENCRAQAPPVGVPHPAGALPGESSSAAQAAAAVHAKMPGNPGAGFATSVLAASPAVQPTWDAAALARGHWVLDSKVHYPFELGMLEGGVHGHLWHQQQRQVGLWQVTVAVGAVLPPLLGLQAALLCHLTAASPHQAASVTVHLSFLL